MKTSLKILILIAVTAMLLSACSETSSIVNTNWQLSDLAGQPALPDVSVTLGFQPESMGGTDGCNSYGGSYTVNGSKLTFGSDIVSTMMYCSDEIQTQSNGLYNALSNTASYQVNNHYLTLIDKDGNTLATFFSLDDAK